MKKSISVFIVILLILFTLIGCKGTSDGGTATPAPSTTGEAGATYFNAGETIKLFQWWNKKDEETFPDDLYGKSKREMVKKLQDENGITIEFVLVDNADQWSVVRESAAQGAPIADGMHCGGTPLMLDDYYYNDIPGSILANLSNYEDKVNFTDPTLFDQEAQKKYGTFTDGLYFFVPKQVGKTSVYMQQACFFNYNLVGLAGIKPEEIYQAVRDKTWNWNMFADMATRSTKTADGIYGFVRGSGGSTIYNLITSNGGEVVGERDVQGTMMDRFVMTDDKAMEAWDFYLDLFQNKKCINPTDYGNDYSPFVAEFAGNKLAFMFVYLDVANALISDKTGMQDGSQFGIVPVPMGPKADRYYAETNWIEPYAMFKDAMNPEGTLYVMKELYKPVYPAGSKEADDLYKVEVGNWCADENAMEMVKLISNSNIYTKHGVYSWTNSYDLLFKALMADQKILDGEITAKAYYTSIESSMNDLIEKVNRVK